jgi:hypothetical protein
MDNISQQEKSLFTQLTNFARINKTKYILADENYVILVPEDNDNEKSKCFEKDENKNWKCNFFNDKDALELFNLGYKNEDNNDTSEEDEVNVDGEDYGN